jgi:hypothetical protein
LSGKRDVVYALTPKFDVANVRPTEPAEIGANTAGRTANKGMEGLAITPDGSTLVGITQSALIQDGGDGKGQILRIVKIDIATGATNEYAYQTENKIKPSDTDTIKTTVSEIVAVNSHVFLVDERDSKGLGDGSDAAFKRLYLVDIGVATGVSGITGKSNLSSKVVKKYLFLDLLEALKTEASLSAGQVPANIEGMAFGDDFNVGQGGNKHTLYIANDNDFSRDAANSNQIFVFAFSDADLAKATASDNSTLGSANGTFVAQAFNGKAAK